MKSFNGYLCGQISVAFVVVGLAACGSNGSKEGAGGTGGAGSGGMSSAAGAGGGLATGGDASSGGVSMGGAGPAGVGGTAGSGGMALSTGGAPSNGGGAGMSGAGGAGSPEGDAGSELPLADFPLHLADASCGALDQCLGAASSSFFDGGNCKASLEPATVEGSASAFAASVAKGTLVYDPTKVSACLTNIRASGCDYPDRRLDALCPDVLVGKVALNGACTVNAECGASAYCKATTCPGTCVSLVAKGGACSADDDCQDGMVCDGTAKKCVVAGKKGASCSETAPCSAAFVCDGAAHCVEFASIFGASEGQHCDPEGQALCAAGLTCALVDIDSMQKGVWSCEKPVTTAPCHVALPEQCAAGNYCELAGGLTGVCKPAPLASKPCASRLPSDATVAKDICAPSLSCWADGLCHAQAHLGEACATDDNCFSGTCKNKSCVAAACVP